MHSSLHSGAETAGQAPPLSRREVLYAMLALTVSILILYGPALLTGRALLGTDVLFDVDPVWQSAAPVDGAVPRNRLLSDQAFQVYPWAVFARASLARGILPLWNPLSGSGTPFIGNAQSALFCPFHLVGYLLPTWRSYGLTVVLRLLVAGLFTYLLARQSGLGRAGALLAMMAFVHCGRCACGWHTHPRT